MKLIILAFILSISLHFLFFSALKEENKPKQTPSSSMEKKKSSVQYVRLMPKKLPKKAKKQNPKQKNKVLVKKELIKKTKPKTFKKVQKKKIIPQKKKRVVKKAKKIIPKTAKKTTIKPSKTKPAVIKPQKKRETVKKSLENFLSEEPIPLDRSMLDNITKSFLKVYGKEYDEFTKVQKVFLQNNLKIFRDITQKVINRLGYPALAARLRLSGSNIVEFIFHPDGNISDLKLSLNAEYKVFDKFTIELIEFAHKDYPRPKVPTKIKFVVNYKVY
jgi:protein TonB